MSIISRVKNFLTAIAGTPVSVTQNCMPIRTTETITIGSLIQQSRNNKQLEDEAVKRLNTTKKDWIIKSVRIWRYIKQLIVSAGKLFFSAIVLVALAHFVPELREQAPSFYQCVDFLIECLDWLYAQFWIIIEKVL